uniref:Ig-like domain-containing protein n=1 Tax=Astyanax mexicanus TaxID=7994 RepID=A0A3B1J0L6_ASTMX
NYWNYPIHGAETTEADIEKQIMTMITGLLSFLCKTVVKIHGNQFMGTSFKPVTSVTIIPNTTELIEFNSTVSLNCSASGSALSFVWLNGSSEITGGERVVLSDSNKTLTVSNVNRHEGGPYTCEASNAISRAKSEPQTLSVNYGPDIAYVRAVPSGPIYSSGSEVILTCSAESSPAAEYQWALDGSVLSDEGQKLTITDIQTTDNGSYTCIAHNTKTLRYSTSQTINITVVGEL